MDKKEYDALKARFLKLYANVPLPLREEIIAVVNDMPVSWNVAYADIRNDGDNAEELLVHLQEIGLL